MKEEVNIAGIIYDIGSTSKTKTGSWRTEKPVVGDCKGCRICMPFCPEGCISMKNKRIEIDYDYCKGCGICANVCPFKAIHMEIEKR